MHVQQRHANLTVASLRWTGKTDLRHRHAELLSNQPDGFRKSNILDLLYKSKNIPRLAAAKTMKKLPRSMHRKRRSLLRMKRTKPRKVLRPSLLQPDVVTHNPDDIRLLFKRLFKVVGR